MARGYIDLYGTLKNAVSCLPGPWKRSGVRYLPSAARVRSPCATWRNQASDGRAIAGTHATDHTHFLTGTVTVTQTDARTPRG